MTHDISPDHFAAQAAWRLMLGVDRVFEAPQAQARWGADTSGLTRPIAGGVRPQSAEQVAEVVRVAHQFGVKLHPISTGHNWGYGTAVPPQDHQVILDLSDLRRIVDFDAELGVVTLEPGVTQGMLHEFLTAGGHPYMVPTTGAGPDCSLVGNALQRGYGITPICDHWSAVTDLEAVRWDGSRYQSPLARAGAHELSRLHRWGVGPYENGLFSQGQAGVVTRMSILLARRPKQISLAVFNLRDDQQLGEVIPMVHEALATLPGTVGGINLMNRLRVLAMTIKYPKNLTDSHGLLPTETIRKLGKKHHIAPWTGVATIYGESDSITSAKKVLRRIFKKIGVRVVFVDQKLANIAEKISRILPGSWGSDMRARASTLTGALDLASGIPNRTALPLAYWKHQNPYQAGINLDPARDGCGLLWFAPLIPMRKKCVLSITASISTIMRDHGFEPLITLTTVSERLFDATTPILFDAGNLSQVSAAQNVLKALKEESRNLGMLPYRSGSISLDASHRST